MNFRGFLKVGAAFLGGFGYFGVPLFMETAV